MTARRVKLKSSNRGVNPSVKRAAGLAAPADDADARNRLTTYLLAVIENGKAPANRRDEMAICLSKILATTRPVRARSITLPVPAKQKQPPKPRVSTYVSAKKQAEVTARTAQNGSSWDGLVNTTHVNGSAHPHDDDEGDEA